MQLILYDVVGAEGFAMDIEYKVTAEGQLIIKQARPWVSFWADITSDKDLGVSAITNPQSSSSLGTEELVTTVSKIVPIKYDGYIVKVSFISK